MKAAVSKASAAISEADIVRVTLRAGLQQLRVQITTPSQHDLFKTHPGAPGIVRV